MGENKEKDADSSKKKTSKKEKEEEEEKKEEAESSSEDEAPTKFVQTKRIKNKKQMRKDESMFTLSNLFSAIILGAIGYCRYHQIRIPVLDDLVAKVHQTLGIGGGGGGDRRPTADSTLTDARNGKPLVLDDLSMQLSRYCGRYGKCTS